MKKSFLSLQVSCKLEYILQPADEYGTYFDLQSFLSDLNENPEIIDLLEEGDCVSTCYYELTPHENNYSLIEIAKSGTASEVPFCLSLSDLKSISDTLSRYDQTRRSLEIGVEFTKPEIEASSFSYESISSGFAGHAYQNLEQSDDEHTLSSFDVAIFSLASYNSYNKLKDRQSCFDKILLPQSETSSATSSHDNNSEPNCEPSEIRASSSNNKTDHVEDEQLNLVDETVTSKDVDSEASASTSNISAELFKEPLIFQSVSGSSNEDPGLMNETIPSPVITTTVGSSSNDQQLGELEAVGAYTGCDSASDSNQPGSQLETSVTSSSYVIPTGLASSSAHAPNTPSNIVAVVAGNRIDTSETNQTPNDELPPRGLEVIGDLQNYLRRQGVEAFSSIKYHPVTQKNVHNLPVFSDTVTFKIDTREYKFQSSRRFARKSDAKKNVAYQAYKALDLYNDGNQQSQVESAIVPDPVESSAVESPAVESPSVESPSVESPAVESPAVESLAVESPADQSSAAGVLHSVESSAVESSPDPNDSELPPKSLNVVGDLSEHLQKLGALDTLIWSDEVGLEFFSFVLSFKINNSEFRFESSKEYPNKKDAKRSAFYNACKDLGLYKK